MSHAVRKITKETLKEETLKANGLWGGWGGWQ
jgi:hypothetical protein